MKKAVKSIAYLSLTAVIVSLLGGCSSLLEEDPDSAQLPWASPAQWENQVPGMPNSGGGF